MAMHLTSGDKPQPQKRRSRVALAVATLLAPGIACYAILLRLLTVRGWKVAAVVLSGAMNLLFLLTIAIALAASDDESLGTGSISDLNAAVPTGFVLRKQGPLYFAELAADSSAIGSRQIAVMFHGCIAASFEFDDGLSVLTSVQVYDDKCRSRTDFDVHSGAWSYSMYLNGPGPEYSTRDEDADGIPDRKINWVTKKSFRRGAPVEWQDVTIHHTNDVSRSDEPNEGD